MDREQAKAHYKLMKEKWVELDIDEYTDIIYDDFESRTCEKCKRNTIEIDCRVVELLESEFGITNPAYFGCNKFERRE